MTTSGEFESDDGSSGPEFPDVFVIGANAFASPAVGAGGPVPDGQRWVLLGADFVGQATGAASLTGFVYDPTSNLISADSITIDPLSGFGSVHWRGAYAYRAGETIQLEARVTGTALGTYCSGWGIVLPYT